MNDWHWLQPLSALMSVTFGVDLIHFLQTAERVSCKNQPFLTETLDTFHENSWHFLQKLLALFAKTLGTFRENPWHFSWKPLALLLGTLGTFRYTLAGKGLEDIGNHVYTYGDEALYVWANMCVRVGLLYTTFSIFFYYIRYTPLPFWVKYV